MDTWKKSSTTALLLTKLQNSVTWTTNTHKTTTRRTGCLQPCASFVVLGSQTLTEMKRSERLTHQSEALESVSRSSVMRESNAHWDEAKRNRSERLTHQSGALVSVSRVVVGKYLLFCVELRVVEQKRYPTRNLLKYSSIFSWNYVS